MNPSKTFAKTAKAIQEENSKILPDVFVQESKAPEVSDIAREELGEKDALGRYTVAHKETAVKAKLARGVAEGLEAYNLVVMKSVRDIKIPGQDPIAPGLRVWRLVAA